jgi:hypothetical protein
MNNSKMANEIRKKSQTDAFRQENEEYVNKGIRDYLKTKIETIRNLKEINIQVGAIEKMATIDINGDSEVDFTQMLKKSK